MKFIVVICRLGDHAQFFALRRPEFLRFLQVFQHCHRAFAPSYDALHLRVAGVPHNDDVPSLPALLLHDIVNSFHKWAGCIDALQFLLAKDPDDLLRNPVGPDDDAALGKLHELLPGLQHLHPLFRKLPYHFLIVHDRAIGIYILPVFYLFIHGVHRALHAEAEAHALRQLYFHRILPSTLRFCTARSRRLWPPPRSCPTYLPQSRRPLSAGAIPPCACPGSPCPLCPL